MYVHLNQAVRLAVERQVRRVIALFEVDLSDEPINGRMIGHRKSNGLKGHQVML